MKQKLGDNMRLTGLEAFSFDYQVQWPLSLVISRKALTKYQLVFRNLFLFKHVERQLLNTWNSHQSTKELDLRLSLASSYSLRQRMLHFLQNLQYYVMFEVLEPNWSLLEQDLKSATTIDELLQCHNDFLDTTLKECMLTDPTLVKMMMRLMSICLMFASHTDTFIKSSQADILVLDQGFVRTVSRFETSFNAALQQLIDSLHQMSTTEANHKMANLVLRLDFNEFYKQYFEKTEQ